MQLSVIVSLSPGREESLDYCLAQLNRQQDIQFEVLVVDASMGSVSPSQTSWQFPLQYVRGASNNPGRSKNLGVAQAQGQGLVFLDADMLLNPDGLQAYAQALQYTPEHLIYGYFGYHEDFCSRSAFFAEQQVFWCDKRFEVFTPGDIKPTQNMLQYPQQLAWSFNFAMQRDLYTHLGGFDEDGHERARSDKAFAEKALEQGLQLHFSLESWAEQHVRAVYAHELESDWLYWRHEPYRATEQVPQPLNYAVGVLQQAPSVEALKKSVFGLYIPHDPFFGG